MKTIAKLIQPILQIYADYLIERLGGADLFEYSVLIQQAVLLDHICVEDFNIYLD